MYSSVMKGMRQTPRLAAIIVQPLEDIGTGRLSVSMSVMWTLQTLNKKDVESLSHREGENRISGRITGRL
jgi:hypothetical protein